MFWEIFSIISLPHVKNEVVLNTNWGMKFSVRTEATGEAEAFFCPCSRGKICILEVLVEELHAYRYFVSLP